MMYLHVHKYTAIEYTVHCYGVRMRLRTLRCINTMACITTPTHITVVYCNCQSPFPKGEQLVVYCCHGDSNHDNILSHDLGSMTLKLFLKDEYGVLFRQVPYCSSHVGVVLMPHVQALIGLTI